jgi:methylenetetrahydrofolate dehydrogenase (NADP+)/methenyltetrahydrofolate cyclohydrolase
MSATVLDGRVVSRNMQAALKAEVDRLKIKTGKVPRFMNIVIGTDPSAASYAKSQARLADHLGIDYQFSRLSEHVTAKELIDHVRFLNEDHGVHGVMIHKPVPRGIDFDTAVGHILPAKDLEGMTAANLGDLLLGRSRAVPCTAAACIALLESTGVDLAGKNAVVVGRSEIVGKPLTLLLLGKNATVTVCHSATSRAGKLADKIREAEVLVAAVGKAAFIKGEWVREGAIVIDVGINEAPGGKIVGDVEYESALERASFITPVPGGVGPVTAVMLMKNGIEIFKQHVGVA